LILWHRDRLLISGLFPFLPVAFDYRPGEVYPWPS